MTTAMATTVNDDSLKLSFVVSTSLHVLFLLFLYFGLPFLWKPVPLPEHQVIIPVEIKTVADITNTNINKEEQKLQPTPTPTPPPPKPVQRTETPPPLTQSPPPPPVPTPIQQAEPLKPIVKPKPPEPAKPKNDDFTKLLKNLEHDKPKETPQTETKPESKAPPAPVVANAPSLSDRLTVSEMDDVRRQVEQCWNPPIGAKNANTMVVQVEGTITQDGIPQNFEIVDKARAQSDGFYRASAEAALRALRDTRCLPLKLPLDKYETWKTFVITFDPRDIQ